jgi:ectoine hydroxylase-related dioxygenase (phytanoyl-CoA dioxygenase family)
VVDRHPLLTAWTALDPATIANGCVKIVPASRTPGLLSRRGHQLSEEHAAEHCPPERIIHLELEPGECVLLQNWLIHGSDINHTDIPRRGFSVCYMHGETRALSDGHTYPVIFGMGGMVAASMGEQQKEASIR